MGRLTADPFLRTTDRSFVPRLSGLLRRGDARASPLSFLAASRGGQTMFPLGVVHFPHVHLPLQFLTTTIDDPVLIYY